MLYKNDDNERSQPNLVLVYDFIRRQTGHYPSFGDILWQFIFEFSLDKIIVDFRVNGGDELTLYR